MLNAVMIEGFIHDVRGAGRYTEVVLADTKGSFFPVYIKERMGKENIAKRVRAVGVLETVACMWRGLESRKCVVMAEFLKEMKK